MAAVSRCLGLALVLLLALATHRSSAQARPTTQSAADPAGAAGELGRAQLLFEQVDDPTDDDSTVDLGSPVSPWRGVSIRVVALRSSVETRGGKPHVALPAVLARGPPA